MYISSVCAIVDVNKLPQNLKALLSLVIDVRRRTIIGFMLCAKLDVNSIAVLVSFWA